MNLDEELPQQANSLCHFPVPLVMVAVAVAYGTEEVMIVSVDSLDSFRLVGQLVC